MMTEYTISFFLNYFGVICDGSHMKATQDGLVTLCVLLGRDQTDAALCAIIPKVPYFEATRLYSLCIGIFFSDAITF